MNDSSPSDVVREVITLMQQQRWSEIPQWMDPAALQQKWDDRIQQARAQQRPSTPPTVEQYRQHQPDMPLEVAQWHVDQHNQVSPDDQFFDVPGIDSLEELERLTPAELMARSIEAGDHRYQTQFFMARAAPDLAKLGFEPPPDRRTVVGEIVTGDLAYVVFVTRRELSGSSEPAIAILRRSRAGWRLSPDGELFGGSNSLFSIGFDTDHNDKVTLPSVPQIEWVKRRFDHQLTPNHFPAVLDRFRAGPSRLDAMSWLPKAIRTAKPDGKWSIQEHVGHLLDLEELGEQRLADFIARVPVLSAADMSNRKTHEANHNTAEWWELLESFRAARSSLCDKLEALPPEIIAHVAEHPRLKRPMNVAEWVFFMCEHDDHHFFRIRELVGPLFTS